MQDRELLELAANAAGVQIHPTVEGKNCLAIVDPKSQWGEHLYWNPLTDDGDALRLAVKLQMEICISADNAWAIARGINSGGDVDHDNDDAYAATRRAIVRAAAEIGKQANTGIERLDGRAENSNER